MKAKKILTTMLLMSLMFTSCAQDKKGDNGNEKDKQEQLMSKPDKPSLSDEQLYNNINNQLINDYSIKQTENTIEALSILSETQTVIGLINESKSKEAKEKLATLIGKLEVLVTNNPEVSFIPVYVAYKVDEVVVDLPQAKAITDEAKVAFDKGYYQVAKDLLNTLRSEYIVETSYLPLLLYPEAMKQAAGLLDKGLNNEANELLLSALNTLMIERIVIPLPVLKAQEYIIEAAVVSASDAKDKDVVAKLLLLNAQYQLELAETMGYGKKDKEFAELQEAIVDIVKAIDDKKKTSNKYDKLKSKMNSFKNRLFNDDKLNQKDK